MPIARENIAILLLTKKNVQVCQHHYLISNAKAIKTNKEGVVSHASRFAFASIVAALIAVALTAYCWIPSASITSS